jgi:predicted glycoside hydrolase/deacetylase ChbG (UPF0249 family)
MNVVINADDFGYNQTVNEAIVDLIVQRRITSSTLIANAPAVEAAVQNIPRAARCSFGVHLNVTEFEPLTAPPHREGLSELLNERGCFCGEVHVRSMKLTSRVKEAIFREWLLQVERVRRLGIKVSHFDSHNHIHTVPALFLVLKRLQEHFGIRKVRPTFDLFAPGESASLLRMLQKRVWNFALRHYYCTTTADAFTSFTTFYELAKVKRLGMESVELMVHPGHVEFEKETQILRTEWQQDLLFSTRLVGYDELKE